MGIFTLRNEVKVELIWADEDEARIRIVTGIYDGGFLVDDSENVKEITIKPGQQIVV